MLYKKIAWGFSVLCVASGVLCDDNVHRELRSLYQSVHELRNAVTWWKPALERIEERHPGITEFTQRIDRLMVQENAYMIATDWFRKNIFDPLIKALQDKNVVEWFTGHPDSEQHKQDILQDLKEVLNMHVIATEKDGALRSALDQEKLSQETSLHVRNLKDGIEELGQKAQREQKREHKGWWESLVNMFT